jgi:hypothetical protein
LRKRARASVIKPSTTCCDPYSQSEEKAHQLGCTARLNLALNQRNKDQAVRLKSRAFQLVQGIQED